MARNIDKSGFFAAARDLLGEDLSNVTRAQILSICEMGFDYPTWITNEAKYRAGRGVYDVAKCEREYLDKLAGKPVASAPARVKAAKPKLTVVDGEAPPIEMALAERNNIVPLTIFDLVPEAAKGYVPFGYFNDVRQIIKSKKFYPTYITGLSGNGKTMMVEQVCAQEKRECVRVNITIETDEDDLIGGFRLVNGHTVWQDGPVIVAMQRGAILLLDEVDLGSNKLMCLQPILEGKHIYLKKTNRTVFPEAGFNVIATANTKGKGSDDGRFIGTNVMNEAFLERFSITLEQEYPNSKVETKILKNVLGASGIEDDDFVDKLVAWADVIRKSFYEGAVSEIISTRRLVHIVEAFAIFNQNREKALQMCLNRFDVDTKTSFMELYSKLDETIGAAATVDPSVDSTISF